MYVCMYDSLHRCHKSRISEDVVVACCLCLNTPSYRAFVPEQMLSNLEQSRDLATNRTETKLEDLNK